MPGVIPKLPNEERPFRMPWLNSCYQQTLLPDAPWHKIENQIAQDLAKKVEKQFGHVDRKEALLEVLGLEFLQHYFPNVKRKPQILEPPNMSGEERQRLMVEAQSWLNSQMYKAVRELGYERMLVETTPGDQSPAGYSEFLQHSFGVFINGLDRELYQQEEQLAKKKKADLASKKTTKDFKVPAPSRVKPISAESGETFASTIKPSTSQIKSSVQNVEGDPPPLWGPQSDAIGSSIVAILERDPRKFETVAGRLHGRQLPGKLRSYMWADVLFKMERKKMKEVYVEKIIRERFAHAVTRGLNELRLKRPTHSPINGLIENAVIEIYAKTTSMVDYKQGDHMKETARCLNVLYVYDRSYEPYLIHWLFPLQLAFRNVIQMSLDKGEHVFELGMYLDLLNTNCFPTWPQVFAIAERVMNTLQQTDPELHDHLKAISTINVKVNPKIRKLFKRQEEFLIQLIHEEKAKAEALLNATPGTVKAENMSSELLADPLIFLRRWIGEGFVSVLDTPGVMYVWDQCFMQGWRHSVLQNFCLSLLELLRHKFMAAHDYVDMKQVFFYEPCKLYTCDIQAAWIHLENGKDLMEVPYQNRQRPLTPDTRQTPSSVATSPLPGLLSPNGIKDIRIKLVVPSESIRREPWLAKVDATNLKLFIGIFFGSIKLRSRLSLSNFLVSSASSDSYGNIVYQLTLPQEKFVNENLDLSQYDVERELGAYPYAILRLEYHRKDAVKSEGLNPVSVGWARIPLFRRSAGGRASAEPIWNLLAGRHTFTLHPGEISESVLAAQPQTPSERTEDSLIGYNSELTAVVYDPRNEPFDDSSPSLSPAQSFTPQVAPADTRQIPPPISPRKSASVVLPTPSPSPALQQQPTPSPALDEDNRPWVEHKTEAAACNPKPTSNSEPFDLYIDGVRFIPDNASIVKVTGRILKAGEIGELQDILAIPDIDGSARSPTFSYRMTINADSKNSNPNIILLIRVYTVDIVTEQIVVIGSCFFSPFNVRGKKGTLRVGGHQLRLHNGMPDSKKGVGAVKSTDLDSAPVIPSCSVLIRLLPHVKDLIIAPKYSLGYYLSESCRPNVSEERIFKSYGVSMQYPKNEKEMIIRLQQIEGVEIGRTDSALLSWLKDRLDIRTRLPVNQPASNLSLIRCVRYRVNTGLNVKINQAFGLPDGYLIECLARIAPGKTVLGTQSPDQTYSQDAKFVTLKHIYESMLQAPAWADEPTELHPSLDPFSCLIIQVFGLEVMYQPQPEHNGPGKLLAVDGTPLELRDEHVLGWTVVPLFEGNSVLMGTHHVPVMKGSPSAEILDELSTGSIQSVLERRVWRSDNRFDSGSLVVTLWDGHYDFQEIPELPNRDYLLDTIGDSEMYRKARDQTTGRRINSIVMDGLEPKYRRQGLKGAIFQKEIAFFETLVTKTFYDLMENAMMNAGYGPL